MSDDEEERPEARPNTQEGFLGDTQLLRIDGTKERVTKLAPGDRVCAAMGGHVTVAACWKMGKRRRELIRITTTTATEMICTPAQRLWSLRRHGKAESVQAFRIIEGDQIWTANHDIEVVTMVESCTKRAMIWMLVFRPDLPIATFRNDAGAFICKGIWTTRRAGKRWKQLRTLARTLDEPVDHMHSMGTLCDMVTKTTLSEMGE